jgi:hypothetical protein
MTPLLILLLLLAIGYWLYREYSKSRRQPPFHATKDAPNRPLPPPHQRVSPAQLEERVRVLRAAVSRGDILLEEAAGSLVRFAGGSMTPERAEELLREP